MRTMSTQRTWLLAAVLFLIAALTFLLFADNGTIGLLFLVIAALFAVFAFTLTKGPR